MMDDLGAHARLTSSDLVTAYRRLCDLLDRYQIKATFAFVAAFSMSEEEARSKLPLFTDVGPRAARWLAPFMVDLASGRIDGWLAPGALTAVRAAGIHEIGSHGFSHLPLAENEIDSSEFSREMRSVFQTDAFVKESAMTLVYPRHQLGFARELGRHGFVGYRDCAEESRSTWRHLSDELNPFPRSQAHPSDVKEIVPVPAARFLNWRSGMRAKIPISWTASIWRKTMEDSVQSGKVTHIYSHPHNFVTGRNMFELLEEIFKAASPRIRAGELWNPTMREYSLALRERNGS